MPRSARTLSIRYDPMRSLTAIPGETRFLRTGFFSRRRCAAIGGSHRKTGPAIAKDFEAVTAGIDRGDADVGPVAPGPRACRIVSAAERARSQTEAAVHPDR